MPERVPDKQHFKLTFCEQANSERMKLSFRSRSPFQSHCNYIAIGFRSYQNQHVFHTTDK